MERRTTRILRAGRAALAAAFLLLPPAAPAAAGPAWPAATGATGPAAGRVTIARLKYGGGGDWYSDPSSLPNLLGEFERRTEIRTTRDEAIVEAEAVDLAAYPFLYVTGHGTVRLSPEGIEAVRGHLLRGGFLWADDNYGMDASFRALVAELFPARPLVDVPLDHPIYHCFYDLDGPPKIHEHDGKPPRGLGVFDGTRLVLFYTYESDVGDGLEDADVHGDPAEKREAAMKMAVNILYYALTR
ncbi:MAG: DUF4159 domain-containing protein [Candidatus Krumholzibacteriota bacterium]|nr:DUF4159 domain-containing protein [Candidatus Krumholzibacteriota bacterium]